MKKILGIGNALVDILITLDSDEQLSSLGIPKGSMQLVDRDRSNRILETFRNIQWLEAAGGSAANTIHALGKLGIPSGFIGMIGEDELGGFFVRDMISAGVEPFMIHSNKDTGRATTLITPDSERTFATYLGAADGLTPGHIDRFSGIFSTFDLLHVEGYLVQNHELVERCITEAKKNNLLISIDLASFNVVEANREFLDRIIRKYVDIVFANEEEAKSFTGMDPVNAVREIAKMCRIAIVKTGKTGSLICSGKDVITIGIIPVNPVDTTGAGDLYAAGFFYGFANDLPLTRCGEMGAILAGNVTEAIGAKMTEERWLKIFETLAG